VLDERHAAKRVRPQEPEARRHDGRAAVGPHDEPGANLELPAVLVLCLYSRDVSTIGHEPCDAVALADVQGQALRALDEDLVQHLARNRQRMVAIAAPRPGGRIDAVERGAVGSDDPHAAERLRPCLVHRLEHAEPIEDPRRLGREILAADLRAREGGFVEESHGPAALGQQDGRSRAGRPRADDDDVYELHRWAFTAWPSPRTGGCTGRDGRP
jgi:hypothetical protein